MAVWSSASSTALNFQAGRRYTHTHVLDAIAAIFLFSVILDRNPSICNVQSHTHTRQFSTSFMCTCGVDQCFSCLPISNFQFSLKWFFVVAAAVAIPKRAIIKGVLLIRSCSDSFLMLYLINNYIRHGIHFI